MKIIQYCGDTGNHSANVTVNQTYLIRKPAILNRAIKLLLALDLIILYLGICK